MTVTGALHFLYMAISLTGIAMYYLGTSDVSKRSVLVVTALLAVHVALGILLPSWVTYGTVVPGAWFSDVTTDTSDG